MNHPDNKRIKRATSDELWDSPTSSMTHFRTPLVENEKMIEVPVDQRTVTRRYTDRAIDFVKENQDKPFFLYLPHSMPHIPLYVPDDVRDPDAQNAYKCVIEHIDAEVGRLVKTLRDLELDKNTIVIFTSDNGPWLPFKNHGGSAKPLRNGKGTPFEGGQRVPCVMWGPGRIPAGTETNAFTTTMDLLPTVAALTESKLPAERRIDGLNISKTLTADESPRNEMVFYSSRGVLVGIRQGDWKYLEITTRPRGNNKKKQEPKTTRYLFNLAEDIGEQNNVLDGNEERANQMIARMKELDKEITDNARPVWRMDEK